MQERIHECMDGGREGGNERRMEDETKREIKGCRDEFRCAWRGSNGCIGAGMWASRKRGTDERMAGWDERMRLSVKTLEERED